MPHRPTALLGATLADTLLQVIQEEPLSPTRLNPQVPSDLEVITLKCLRKEPGRRYSSAAELAEELRRFRAGEPIQARPAGRLERGWRWCKRNPAGGEPDGGHRGDAGSWHHRGHGVRPARQPQGRR